MIDLSNETGDLGLAPSGDLAPIGGVVRTNQRVIRRLMTTPGTYLFHLDYGAGLPAMVGRTIDAGAIAAAVRAQMYAEEAVAHVPEPVVTVYTDESTVVVLTISYVYLPTNETVSLTLPIQPGTSF